MKCNFWRLAVRYDIYVIRQLKVKVSGSCLCLLTRLPVTSILTSIFTSVFEGSSHARCDDSCILSLVFKRLTKRTIFTISTLCKKVQVKDVYQSRVAIGDNAVS